MTNKKINKQTNDNTNKIALKGAIPYFFTISSLRRELSLTRTLKWPERNRVQITCNMSCATWYEGTAQLLSLTELKWRLF